MGLVRLFKEAFQGIENDGIYPSVLIKTVTSTSSKLARPVFEKLNWTGSIIDEDKSKTTRNCQAKNLDSLKDLCCQIWRKVDPKSLMLPLPDLKEYLREYCTLHCEEIVSEGSQWLATLTEQLQAACNAYGSSFAASQEIPEGFEKFDDFSDIFQDLIKTIKFLMTFEVKNGVHDELLVPHFNFTPTTNEIVRQPKRRCIGGR